MCIGNFWIVLEEDETVLECRVDISVESLFCFQCVGRRTSVRKKIRDYRVETLRLT